MLGRTESPSAARTAQDRVSAPPEAWRARRAYAGHYGRRALEAAREWGISPHEAAIWNIEFKYDEVVEYHRPLPSPFPPGVVKLAFQMIVQARHDLRYADTPASSWRYREQAKDYRPDPDGARAYFERESDEPLQFVWCCQVLGVDPDAVRRRIVG